MNKRTRKKYLKSHGLYVDPHELWNLDDRLARYILPRLKAFRKLESSYKGYPGYDEADTPEHWDECVDKMIRAFEIVIGDYGSNEVNWIDDSISQEEKIARQEHITEEYREGMALFAKFFASLWW